MGTLNKKLNQFRQWSGEKLGVTEKTIASGEFRRLEQETDVRMVGIERLSIAATDYTKTMDKRSSQDKKVSTLAMLAKALVQQGQHHGKQSPYGDALIRVGECQDRIQAIQERYAESIRQGFLMETISLHSSMKEYASLKKKLENRRLDYDAKQNKLNKSIKENPGLEEEVKIAQVKYDETLAVVESLMASFAEREANMVGEIQSFVNAQYEYFKKGLENLEDLKGRLADDNLPASEVNDNGQSSFPRPSGLEAVLPPSLTNKDVIVDANALILEPPGAIENSQTGSREKADKSTAAPGPKIPSNPKSVEEAEIHILYDFKGENEDELSCQKGERVYPILLVDTHWLQVRNKRGKIGIVPINYTNFTNKSDTSKNMSVRECHVTAMSCNCGCDNFALHPFKAGICNNCFHRHE